MIRKSPSDNIKIYNLTRVHYTKINVEPFTYNLQNQEHLNNMIYKPKRLRSTKDTTRDLGSRITIHLR